MKIKLIDFGLLTKFTPFRAHVNDAGADVFSPVTRVLNPGTVTKIPLRFGVELPDGTVGFVFPRSSLSAKGITCELPPIDSGYRGEVGVILANLGDEDLPVRKGDKVAQIVVAPVTQAVREEADEIDETDRGAGGFGSTGV